jgi:hypothetical protein
LRSLKLTGDLMKLAGTMTAKPIPDGYRAVTPYLFVEER